MENMKITFDIQSGVVCECVWADILNSFQVGFSDIEFEILYCCASVQVLLYCGAVYLWLETVFAFCVTI